MITDVLENINLYSSCNKGFRKAVQFLMRNDLREMPPGEYEIDGKSVYAIISKNPGRDRMNAQLETHRKYIDIQLLLSGTDRMGWKTKSLCKNANGEYDEANDIQLFADNPDVWLSTGSGQFAIFFPDDAHMPSISTEELHKVIVKVALT